MRAFGQGNGRVLETRVAGAGCEEREVQGRGQARGRGRRRPVSVVGVVVLGLALVGATGAQKAAAQGDDDGPRRTDGDFWNDFSYVSSGLPHVSEVGAWSCAFFRRGWPTHEIGTLLTRDVIDSSHTAQLAFPEVHGLLAQATAFRLRTPAGEDKLSLYLKVFSASGADRVFKDKTIELPKRDADGNIVLGTGAPVSIPVMANVTVERNGSEFTLLCWSR